MNLPRNWQTEQIDLSTTWLADYSCIRKNRNDRLQRRYPGVREDWPEIHKPVYQHQR